MKISPTSQPWEEGLDKESRDFLAFLRSVPAVPEDEDPNDWLSQICQNLRRPPRERLERWTRVADEALAYKAGLVGVAHVEFSPRRVMQALVDQGVAFVLVGMGAGYVQGAPYPTTNTDLTPRLDWANVGKVEQVLDGLGAVPLAHDLWYPVDNPVRPGFRRLMTAAGMVNVVDALPGVGGYGRLMGEADLLDLGEGLSVWVAALRDVIRSKERVERTLDAERTRDGLHVMMCKETVQAKAKYGF